MFAKHRRRQLISSRILETVRRPTRAGTVRYHMQDPYSTTTARLTVTETTRQYRQIVHRNRVEACGHVIGRMKSKALSNHCVNITGTNMAYEQVTFASAPPQPSKFWKYQMSATGIIFLVGWLLYNFSGALRLAFLVLILGLAVKGVLNMIDAHKGFDHAVADFRLRGLHVDFQLRPALLIDSKARKLAFVSAPMATSNSPTFGRVKFPQAGRSDYQLIEGAFARRAAASLSR